MAHTDELLNRDALDRNPVFAHERWQVRLENGQTAGREMIRHPGGVAIVVVDADDRLLICLLYTSAAHWRSCPSAPAAAARFPPRR